MFKEKLSADDKIVLDRLLSKLAGSINGGLDFWILVCIADLTPDRHEFIRQQCEIMRSLVIVTRTVLNEGGFSRKPPIPELLNRMTALCQKQQDAYLLLAECHHLSLEEIRAGTEAVASVYTEFRQTIRELAHVAEVRVSFLENRPPESNRHMERILNNLFEIFRDNLPTMQAPAAIASGQP